MTEKHIRPINFGIMDFSKFTRAYEEKIFC